MLAKLLGRVGFSLTAGRIVDVPGSLLVALQNHKMVQVPVKDRGHGKLAQSIRIQAKALGFQTVLTGGLEDFQSVGAVAGDPHIDAKLFEGNPAPVIGQNHGQRGGPALDGLHLLDARSLDATLGEIGSSRSSRQRRILHQDSPEADEPS